MTVGSALVHLCPDCGAHLGDTWDPDEQECTRCGFAYVRVESASRTTSTTTPVHDTARMYAGVAAIGLSALSGMAISSSKVVTEVQTANGAAISFNGPDGAFWASGALLAGAVLLLAYVTVGGRSR